ncbi:nuclear receptor coactivator 4-like [Ptychodera flava]|uniref:nuclear receptor coactivator 4-like n=1 Tax=Ptychodera flava TaxID=63121 RepID=UPI00396A2601
MSCNLNRQQQLVNEVKHNIAILEDAIHQVEDTKKNLKISGLEVKGQIHSCISRQLEALRNREVWLLNQVETVQHAKEESLRLQLAKLNQCLGSLRNCITYTQQYVEGLHEDADPKVVERQLMENLNRMARLNLTPEENASICFRADRNSIRDVIHGFGRIDSRSVSVNQERAFTDPTLPSSSLPSPFEDYEDLDHHVLYKTLAELKDQEQKQKAGPSNLARSTEDWLMKAPTPTNSPAETIPETTFPPFNKRPQPSKTTTVKRAEDVQKWLHHVPIGYRTSQSSSEEDFVMLSHSKESSEITSATSAADEELDMEVNTATTPYFNQVSSSPSVDWLLDADRIRASYTYGKDYPYAVMKYFREISNDVKDWLWKYEARQEEEQNKNEKKDCKAGAGCCGASKSQVQQIEIENLDTLLCVSDGMGKLFKDLPSEKEKWLAKERKEDTASDCKILEDVCMANEKCHEPSECVCDSHCMGSQFDQSEARYDLYGEWGKAVSNNMSDWLKPQTNETLNEEAKESAVFEYFHLIQASETSEWLNNNRTTGGTKLCLTTTHSPLDGYLHSLPQNNSFWLPGYKAKESCFRPSITSTEMKCFDKNSADLSMWVKPQPANLNSQPNPMKECNTVSEKLKAFHGDATASFWLQNHGTDKKDEMMSASAPDTGFSEIFNHDESEREKWLLVDSPMDVSDDLETLSIAGKTVEINMTENDGLFPCFHQKTVNNHMWLLNYTH